MEMINSDSGKISLKINKEEYGIIYTGLFEVVGGFFLKDFDSKIGASEDVVREMHDIMYAIIVKQLKERGEFNERH